MLTAQLDFKCNICGCEKFFVMPVGKLTKSGDTVTTLSEYLLKCKKCLKAYILDFSIKAC